MQAGGLLSHKQAKSHRARARCLDSKPRAPGELLTAWRRCTQRSIQAFDAILTTSLPPGLREAALYFRATANTQLDHWEARDSVAVALSTDRRDWRPSGLAHLAQCICSK